MMREYPKWRDFLLKQLAEPEAAIDYLDFTLEEFQVDKNITFFLKEVRTVIEAQGGVGEVAKRAAMVPETLLEILSGEEAPRIDMLTNILTALGCRLSIEPLKTWGCPLTLNSQEIQKFQNLQINRHNWLNQIQLSNGGINNG